MFEGFVAGVLNVAAVCVAVTAMLVLIEKIWKPLSRFLQREINEPVERQIIDLTDKLDEHTAYVRYHLGPNGDAPAVHHRLSRVESKIGD